MGMLATRFRLTVNRLVALTNLNSIMYNKDNYEPRKTDLSSFHEIDLVVRETVVQNWYDVSLERSLSFMLFR